ncbi:MAG: phage/plasmid primase, P4 family [Acidimicrobiia bacterium]|nr:phage/plasmid primase, P4 family [Acidimicrobiia bacterium]
MDGPDYGRGGASVLAGVVLRSAGTHWHEIEDDAVRAEIYAATKRAVYEKLERGVPMLESWAPTRRKVSDVVDALHAETHLPERTTMPSWTDGTDGPPAAELVAARNGLLHVPTRELHPHDPRFWSAVSVPYDYDPDAPRPERWLGFLDELWPDDPESVDALQRYFGYVISGRTDLHKILLLVGPTRAGKGVIARVLAALVGRQNVAGPTLASLGTNFGLQDLIGKPLAVISDARLSGNTTQVVERLLSVSGEDTLTIDRKYRDPWTGKLPTRFVVISNEIPRFGDASGAIARRFVVLQLSRSFLGEENPKLTDELLEELPGILSWSLDGLDTLTAEGHFPEPAATREAMTALQDLASPVAAFVRDRCQVGPEHEADVEQVWRAWQDWCQANGRDRPGTKQVFGRDLRAAVPGLSLAHPRDGETRHRVYCGLGVANR